MRGAIFRERIKANVALLVCGTIFTSINTNCLGIMNIIVFTIWILGKACKNLIRKENFNNNTLLSEYCPPVEHYDDGMFSNHRFSLWEWREERGGERGSWFLRKIVKECTFKLNISKTDHCIEKQSWHSRNVFKNLSSYDPLHQIDEKKIFIPINYVWWWHPKKIFSQGFMLALCRRKITDF